MLSLAGILKYSSVDVIKTLKELGIEIVMLGDGINEAPALVQEDMQIVGKISTEISRFTIVKK